MKVAILMICVFIAAEIIKMEILYRRFNKRNDKEDEEE